MCQVVTSTMSCHAVPCCAILCCGVPCCAMCLLLAADPLSKELAIIVQSIRRYAHISWIEHMHDIFRANIKLTLRCTKILIPYKPKKQIYQVIYFLISRAKNSDNIAYRSSLSARFNIIIDYCLLTSVCHYRRLSSTKVSIRYSCRADCTFS